MIAALLLAVAAVFGLPLVVVLGLGLFLLSPLLGLCVVSIWGVLALIRRRRAVGSGLQEEVLFLREVAATMSSGATLRGAIAASSSPVVDERTRRLCTIGVPMAVVSPALVERLPETGGSFAVVADMAESVGSSIVEACQVLAEEAEASHTHRGELRVSTAQARFSAVIVGVVPLAIAGLLVLFRGIPEPGGAVVVLPMATGTLFMVFGTALVVFLSGRSVS